jgi:hypothetical protein
MMPRKKNKSKKTGKKRASINPSESVVIYRGPLSLPLGSQERQKITTMLHYGTQVLNSSAGTVSLVIADDPSGCTDWSVLSGAWDEFRVLGIVFHYHPYDRYNQATSITVAPCFTVIDRDDAVALTNETQALEYESLKVFNLADPWRRELRSLASIEDATFITTAAPVGRNWLKFVANAVATSTSYGKYWVDFMVQFRGRN